VPYRRANQDSRVRFDWGESVQDSDEEDLNQAYENSIASSKPSSSSSLSKEESL